MNKASALLHYQSYFNLNEELERNLYSDTIVQLERTTRASEVATIVGRLYDVNRINSSVVKSRPFIETIITIAENMKKGNSINNVRDHIKKVIGLNEWERHEEQERRQHRGRPFRICGDTVVINCAITIRREDLMLLKSVIHQFDSALEKVDIIYIRDLRTWHIPVSGAHDVNIFDKSSIYAKISPFTTPA